jgi:hypothetical protein
MENKANHKKQEETQKRGKLIRKEENRELKKQWII